MMNVRDNLANIPPRSSLRRLCIVAVPASVITGSLFALMQSAVEVDDFSPPEQVGYVLEPYINPPIIEDPLPEKIKPQRPDIVDPPPRAPNLVKDINVADAPQIDYYGKVPADYGDADLDLVKPRRATSVIDRTILPITPPVPNYPSAAAKRGLEGSCDVFLSVSIRGEPFNVRADCTDRVFESAARKAVQKVKFAPQIRDGLPVTVTGVVYPLEFRMEP